MCLVLGALYVVHLTGNVANVTVHFSRNVADVMLGVMCGPSCRKCSRCDVEHSMLSILWEM